MLESHPIIKLLETLSSKYSIFQLRVYSCLLHVITLVKIRNYFHITVIIRGAECSEVGYETQQAITFSIKIMKDSRL